MLIAVANKLHLFHQLLQSLHIGGFVEDSCHGNGKALDHPTFDVVVEIKSTGGHILGVVVTEKDVLLNKALIGVNNPVFFNAVGGVVLFFESTVAGGSFF